MEEIPEKLVLDIPMLQSTSKSDRIDPPSQKQAKTHSGENRQDDNFDAAYASETDAAKTHLDDGPADVPAVDKETASTDEQSILDEEAEELSVVIEDQPLELGEEVDPKIALPANEDASKKAEISKPKSGTNEWAFEQMLAANKEIEAADTENIVVGKSAISGQNVKTSDSMSDAKNAAMTVVDKQPNNENPLISPPTNSLAKQVNGTVAPSAQDTVAVATHPTRPNELNMQAVTQAVPPAATEQVQKNQPAMASLALSPQAERAPERAIKRSAEETSARAETKPTTPPQTPSVAPSVAPAQPVTQLTTSKDLVGLDADLSLRGEIDSPTTWDARTSTVPATLAQTIARPETPGLIARQMAEVLQRLPDRPVEVALNPEELGRVRLSISASEAGITVSVLAERPETLDLMRRHIDQLAREFEALGYSNINFAFNKGQSEQNASQQDGAHDGPNSSQMKPDATTETNTPIQLAASSGVDLRL